MLLIADMIKRLVKDTSNESLIEEVKKEAIALSSGFPID